MRQTMFRADLYQGQRILVTGGGTGLGYAMARQLAALGATVHLCGRRLAVLEQAAEALRRDFGGQAHAHAVDIRDASAVDAMVAGIWATTAGWMPWSTMPPATSSAPPKSCPSAASTPSPIRFFAARST